MKLNSIEKAIVAVIVIGGILAAGIFLFIIPAYNEIGVANKKYESLVTEKASLDAELSREATIDQEIVDAKKGAKQLEGSFYPDLTTYEASEIALAYLEANNLKTLAIKINNISVESLSLETYVDVPVQYDLKKYSQSARDDSGDALLEGQFKDGSKVYTIYVNGVADVSIVDSEGATVDKKKYTDTMKKAYNNALCEYVMRSESKQDVGSVEVTYDVTGTYKDYLGFLDYINELDRATRLEKIKIPMSKMGIPDNKDDNGVIETDVYMGSSSAPKAELILFEDDTEVKDYEVTLKFLCVEQMEELASIEAGGQSIVVNQ